MPHGVVAVGLLGVVGVQQGAQVARLVVAGRLHPRAALLHGGFIVQVERLHVGRAVAEGVAGRSRKGGVGEARGQHDGRAPARGLHADLAHPPQGVIGIQHGLPAGIGQAGDLATRVVGVGGGVGGAAEGVGAAGQALLAVVGEGDGGRSVVFDRAQMPDAMGAGVVDKGVGRGARHGAALVGDAVEGVVGVGGDLAHGVGAGDEVARGVEGARGGAGVGAHGLERVAPRIRGVLGDLAVGVAHLGEVVEAVVGHLVHPAVGLGHLDEAVERVVLVAGDVADVGARTALGGEVGVSIERVGDGLVVRAHVLAQTPQGVVDAAVGVGHVAAAIHNLLLGDVARGVQGVGDVAAVGQGEAGETVRGVVAVGHGAAVGAGDLGEIAHRVVLVLGGLGADLRGGESVQGVVAELDDQTVGVGDVQRLARGVVGVHGGGLPQGVGHALDLPAAAQGGRARTGGVRRIEVGGGGLRHVGARTGHDHLQHRARHGAGVGIGHPGGAAQVVGRVGLHLLRDVAVAVVGVGGGEAALREGVGQPEVGVPGVAGGLRHAGAGRGRARQHEVAAGVPGEGGVLRGAGIARGVGVARHVAVGVVGYGQAVLRIAAARTRGLDLGVAQHPQQALVGVGVDRPQGLGDAGAAAAKAQRHLPGRAGVAGLGGLAAGVVGVAGVGVAVFVHNAGEQARA